MKFLNILKLVATLWPIISSLVTQVEESFPEAGIGKFKLNEVLNILRESWAAADITFDEAARALTSAIGAIVKLKNITGKFKTGGDPQTELPV